MKSGMTINYWLGDDGSLQNAMDGSAAMRGQLPRESEDDDNYWTRLIDVRVEWQPYRFMALWSKTIMR